MAHPFSITSLQPKTVGEGVTPPLPELMTSECMCKAPVLQSLPDYSPSQPKRAFWRQRHWRLHCGEDQQGREVLRATWRAHLACRVSATWLHLP